MKSIPIQFTLHPINSGKAGTPLLNTVNSALASNTVNLSLALSFCKVPLLLPPRRSLQLLLLMALLLSAFSSPPKSSEREPSCPELLTVFQEPSGEVGRSRVGCYIFHKRGLGDGCGTS